LPLANTYHSTADFIQANFFLFPKVKTVIKRFQQVKNIKDVTAKLNAVPLMAGLSSY
jgi:hypothetical protein